MFQVLSIITIILLSSTCTTAKILWTENEKQITIENGYTYLSFNKNLRAIDIISADYFGNSNYGNNNLAKPFSLQVVESFENTIECKSDVQFVNPIEITWIIQSDELIRLRISNIYDMVNSNCNPIVNENWILTLTSEQRSVTVNIEGHVLRNTSVDYILHGIYSTSPSLYGLFHHGVVQMMNNNDSCLGTSVPLNRAYMLGNNNALDIIKHKYNHIPNINSDNFDTDSTSTAVLKSAFIEYNSGIEDVIYGTYPNISMNMASAWNKNCWKNVKPTYISTITKNKEPNTWQFGMTFIPNNYNFPVYLLNNIRTTPSISFLDMNTYLTGIYASSIGCLQSYYAHQDGIIAPTIAHPDTGYSPDTNFFDPDNFLTLSAMIYSNDYYFLKEIKTILLRTSETMCGIGRHEDMEYCNQTVRQLRYYQTSAKNKAYRIGRKHKLYDTKRFQYKTEDEGLNTRSGQLMHHFISLSPTYESIAGSEQLGPNIFWSLSVLQYIAITQDSTFAEFIFPYIDLSLQYILSFYDAEKGLFLAPGPLWIDVLVRENYTSDTNSMLVYFLTKIADYYDYMHMDKEFAMELRQLSDTIRENIINYLYNTDTYDHFVTQLNSDDSTRDFVDYDSNLMTIAYNIVRNSSSIARMIERIDNGEHTHIRATWCSEVPYSGNSSDCYIVGGDYCGDSVVTLARIGYIDAIARKQIGDLKTFEQLILIPLQMDLLEYIWLCERYDSVGNQIRTPYYFEYPSLITILLREIRYGININLLSIHINPFPAMAYNFSLGFLSIEYNIPERVVLSLPGVLSTALEKDVILENLALSTLYNINNTCVQSDASSSSSMIVQTDQKGVLLFRMKFASSCTVTVTMID